MATITEAPPGPTFATVADLLEQLGNIPAHRVLMHPTPGTATERDVIAIHDREKRRYELVDGVLVEKTMGYDESRFALMLVFFLIRFVRERDLGHVVGIDAPMRLFRGRVRYPDVAFVSWERTPKGKRRKPIADLAPDLAVEILSKSNTPKEMDRKLGEYFRAGVRMVWYVDPRKRTVRVYTGPGRPVVLGEDDTLDGGDVLPGFRLPIREWFAEAELQGPRGS